MEFGVVCAKVSLAFSRNQGRQIKNFRPATRRHSERNREGHPGLSASSPLARGLAGKKVEVVDYPDGRFAVRHQGLALPFRVFDKIQTASPGAIVENKRLGAAPAFAQERLEDRSSRCRSLTARL